MERSSLAHVVVNLCVPWLLVWHAWCAVIHLSVHRSVEGNVPPPLVAAWWVVAAALSLIWSQDSAQAMVVLPPQNAGLPPPGHLHLHLFFDPDIGIKDALVELAAQGPVFVAREPVAECVHMPRRPAKHGEGSGVDLGDSWAGHDRSQVDHPALTPWPKGSHL